MRSLLILLLVYLSSFSCFSQAFYNRDSFTPETSLNVEGSFFSTGYFKVQTELIGVDIKLFNTEDEKFRINFTGGTGACTLEYNENEYGLNFYEGFNFLFGKTYSFETRICYFGKINSGPDDESETPIIILSAGYRHEWGEKVILRAGIGTTGVYFSVGSKVSVWI